MALRICANENISGATVSLLRRAGHDVLWVREAAPGISDEEVLSCSQSENRLLLTFDKDFGDLVYRRGASASSGIILLRVSLPSPSTGAEKIVRILSLRDDWNAHYSVVDDIAIRMRELPAK